MTTKRVKLRDNEEPLEQSGGSYFAAPKTKIDFIGSGAALLDCVVGGGWPLGRVSNIVGDKSTGKTLLAIEACANMLRKYPEGRIWYREVEAAFDLDYAAALGMPVSRIDFSEKASLFTIEQVAADIEAILKRSERQPGLYIIDSLDALSDAAELERDLGEATYGTAKAKGMSEMFRRITQKVEASNIHLMFISQIRDNIGALVGKKYTRAGGHALDFYASQVVWLSKLEQLNRTIDGVARAVGVRIKAKCEKNKIALPFRECELDLKFGYGIDELGAGVDWLASVKRLPDIGGDIDWTKKDAKGKLSGPAQYFKHVDALPDAEYRAETERLNKIVTSVWYEIEQQFLPTRRKY